MAKAKTTAAERAQEALDTANRVLERIEKRIEESAKTLESLKSERRTAISKRDYLAQNPDLPQQDNEPPAIEPVDVGQL